MYHNAHTKEYPLQYTYYNENKLKKIILTKLQPLFHSIYNEKTFPNS